MTRNEKTKVSLVYVLNGLLLIVTDKMSHEAF